MKNYLMLVSLLFTLKTSIYAQCIAPGTIPTLSCGSGSLLVNGDNINSGQTRFSNGGAFSNISLNGGDLVLCGTVTINNINLNSGRLFINAGATVSFTGNFSTGTHSLYNLGDLSISSNIAIQGTGTFVYNDKGATITVTGDLTVFNSGLFVNYGRTVANNISINSGEKPVRYL